MVLEEVSFFRERERKKNNIFGRLENCSFIKYIECFIKMLFDGSEIN